MNIQWFPGHMTKTRRMMEDSLKLIDVVVELLDARIPYSSRNPDIDSLIGNKPKITVLNKSDIADPEKSKEWQRWFKKTGQELVFIDCKSGKGLNQLKSMIRNVMQEKIDRDKEKGRVFRTIKIMIVGIPNVGKSTMINKMAGKRGAITADRPGVTRGKQWIRLSDGLDLLDTPGILWPKFEDEEVGINLALTGAIRDQVVDVEELSIILLDKLKELYPDYLMKRYNLDSLECENTVELLDTIGKKRGCILRGGVVDYARVAPILLDEFRGGIIGNITLETPEGEL